ncbi:hypothetical protein [Streptomyces brasiliensis]|uniref:Uncharacterized protein n=1 Tax=Streptomyces brasiliensis TaxID=1954 RepID=A0A917NPJ4_9ACTN|nr:hypothetical protein [Streptomyces brasiliensis]GGJ13176.1 hypothetical protein GCM10010121_024420 [Streptomyces brasiliensis]
MDALSALAVAGLPPLVLAVLVLSVWQTARGLRTHRWVRPVWWFFPSFVLAAVGFFTWIIGAFSGGLDVGESCALRGIRYDDAYRAEHWREPSRWFPLHNRCNADHDLVPAFVNPTLVAVAVLLLGCVAGALAAAVIGGKKHP